MYNFHVGQKVVCVDDSDWDEDLPNVSFFGTLDGLQKGMIYTIREIYFDEVFGENLVRLCEIIRPNTSFKMRTPKVFFEGGYSTQRFRPLINRKTDISIFTNMLRDVHADA